MSGKLLARNTTLNLIGQIVPLLVGVVTIPFIVRGLGTERFGLLSMAWVVLGYFIILDLGLGRATTKFVAEALGKGETERLPHLIWTSLGIHILLGLMGGLLLATLTPILVEQVFKISPALIGEARSTFFILAISVPIILASRVLRGVLEAGQRFDLVNAVKIPLSSLIFVLPVIGILLDIDLPGIMFLLFVTRLCDTLAYLLFCLRVFPILRKIFSFESKTLRPLISYGGWITISNAVGPVLVYLDRFLIGSLLSMSAVAYYTAPYEVVSRISIVPASLVMVLFPVFSALGTTSKEVLTGLYTRSIKYLILIMGPLVLVLIMFAEEILKLWLGSEFAEKSTLVFQILAVGILFNSVARVPFSLLQGLGRPDITAKFHLLELLLYVPLIWFLVENMGIAGGALAWTLRVLLDTFLLFGAPWRLYNMSFCFLAANGLLRCIAVFAVLAGALLTVLLLSWSIPTQVAITTFLIVLFILASYRYVLDTRDKKLFISILTNR